MQRHTTDSKARDILRRIVFVLALFCIGGTFAASCAPFAQQGHFAAASIHESSVMRQQASLNPAAQRCERAQSNLCDRP